MQKIISTYFLFPLSTYKVLIKSCLVLAQFNLFSLMFNEKTVAILTEPVRFLLVIYPHTTCYREAWCKILLPIYYGLPMQCECVDPTHVGLTIT